MRHLNLIAKFVNKTGPKTGKFNVLLVDIAREENTARRSWGRFIVFNCSVVVCVSSFRINKHRASLRNVVESEIAFHTLALSEMRE